MQTRRWCRPHENTATMTCAAVAKLCEERPELVDEIDVVLVASGTTMPIAHPSDPENRAFADLAPLVLAQLGRNRALGLDLKACYCSGFLRGLQVADGLLANANYRSALGARGRAGQSLLSGREQPLVVLLHRRRRGGLAGATPLGAPAARRYRRLRRLHRRRQAVLGRYWRGRRVDPSCWARVRRRHDTHVARVCAKPARS